MILITGGAGFIGSNQAKYFVTKDEDVRILDNFSTGSMKNIEQIKNNVEIIKGSIGNRQLIKKSLKDVDIVLHNAAFLGVKNVVENPWKVFDENNYNNHIFFSEIINSDVKKLIYASSSEVYQDRQKIPFSENDSLIFSNPYPAAKRLFEIYCKILFSRYGIDTCSFRYFNVYGPNQNSTPYGFVISIFLKNTLENKTLTVYGDGEQTRDFTFIDDIANANLLAIRRKMKGEILNIGSGTETSINNLANMVINLTCKKLEIVHKEPREYEDRRRVADITKAKELLGWYPKVSLKEGLNKTWKWILSEKS
jgi:nucleoside-diphosphate-sugar epimerase